MRALKQYWFEVVCWLIAVGSLVGCVVWTLQDQIGFAIGAAITAYLATIALFGFGKVSRE